MSWNEEYVADAADGNLILHDEVFERLFLKL